MNTPAQINCRYRSLVGAVPVCQQVANVTGLHLDQCRTNDGACRHCLQCEVPPEMPNSVVASMAMAAAMKLQDEAAANSIKLKVQPYLTRSPTTAPRATAAQLPCIHRGELLRQVECELCGDRGTMVDVYQCNLPGAETECTPGRWSKKAPHPNKTCLGCSARQSPVQIDSPEEPRPYLSIVMPTYDDWDGVWLTVQTIRTFFRHVTEKYQIEIVCLDTNPGGNHGNICQKWFRNWCNGHPQQGDKVTGRYIAAGGTVGPAAAKQAAIEAARGEYVLCMDCHLILQPGSLDALVAYFDAHPDTQDLIQGPYIADNFKPMATHMAQVWGGDNMKGVWAVEPSVLDALGNVRPDAEPFEIPQMGMGLFACRRDSWLGFNPLFRGFIVEEGYIHEKYRKAGHKAICIPQLQWLHRTDRANGAPYKVHLEDRFRGYLIRAAELGEDPAEYLRQFQRTDQNDVLPPQAYWQIVQEMSQRLGVTYDVLAATPPAA